MLKLLLCSVTMVVTTKSAIDCDVKNSYSGEVAQKILDAHNAFRSKLATGKYKHWPYRQNRFAPTATNMRKMFWDCDVQREAQEATEIITNDPTCPKKKHTQGGQNGYWGGIYENRTMDSSATDALVAWANEFMIFTNKLIVSRDNGHAIQAAWGNSDKLGCGVSKCRPPDRTIRVFCHYSPSGNYAGTPAYEIGETCSNCGKGFKCESKETGLCIPE